MFTAKSFSIIFTADSLCFFLLMKLCCSIDLFPLWILQDAERFQSYSQELECKLLSKEQELEQLVQNQKRVLRDILDFNLFFFFFKIIIFLVY